MKTTLEIPDLLFRKAKSKAAERGQTLKQLVTVVKETTSGRCKCSNATLSAACSIACTSLRSNGFSTR